jgi:hypothetical protein
MRTKENDHLSKYYTNSLTKNKIDKCLQQHASLQSTLGLDSTQKQIKNVVREQLKLEAEIKKLDLDFWETTFKVEKQ